MADHHIQFKIGSTFSGEGMQKAQQAVGQLKQQVNTGAEAVSKISAEIGAMDSKAATAMRAVSGLMSVFTSMNPIMIGISGTIAIVTTALKKLRKAEEETKKAAEEQTKAMSSMLTVASGRIFDQTIQDCKSLGVEFDKITNYANQISAAIKSLDNSFGQKAIMQLQVDKINAVAQEITEEGKALTAAMYDNKIALQKAANTHEQVRLANNAAAKAITDEQARRQVLMEEREEIENSINRISESIALMAEADKDARAKAVEKIKLLRAKEEEIDNQIIDSKNKVQVLLYKKKETLTNGETAELQMQLEVAKTAEALKKVNDDNAFVRLNDTAKDAAVDLMAIEEEERKFAESKILSSLKESYDALKAEVDKEKDSKKALMEAEAKYKSALEEYNSNIQTNAINEAFNSYFGNSKISSLLKSGVLPVDVQKSVQTRVADQKVDEAIRNGVINNVKDADRARRQAEREARNAMTKNSGQRAQETKRYERLMATPKKNWSQADAKFVATYDKIKEAGEAQKKKMEEAKKAMDDAAKDQKLQQQKVELAQEDLSNKVAQMSDKIDFPAVTQAINNMKQALADCVKLN